MLGLWVIQAARAVMVWTARYLGRVVAHWARGEVCRDDGMMSSPLVPIAFFLARGGGQRNGGTMELGIRRHQKFQMYLICI